MSGARIWRISDSSDNHRRCLRTLLSLGRVSKLSMSNAYESYVHLPTPGAACAAPDAHSHNTPVEHGEDGLAGQAHANCNDGTEHMGLPSRVTLTKAEVASAHLVSLRALEFCDRKSRPKRNSNTIDLGIRHRFRQRNPFGREERCTIFCDHVNKIS